jgi:hypothetical protein
MLASTALWNRLPPFDLFRTEYNKNKQKCWFRHSNCSKQLWAHRGVKRPLVFFFCIQTEKLTIFADLEREKNDLGYLTLLWLKIKKLKLPMTLREQICLLFWMNWRVQIGIICLKISMLTRVLIVFMKDSKIFLVGSFLVLLYGWIPNRRRSNLGRLDNWRICTQS